MSDQGDVTIIRGDARSLPLADESVDLIVTSPPYWSLRSYTDGGRHYDRQLGAEPTPAAYVDNLLDCTREWMRVLKSSGSLWINLGDKSIGKSLAGLPWRYTIGCLDHLGLLLRAEVIWSKTNAMPGSAKDRVQRSHEQWFHFTKTGQYYSAIDVIRESYSGDRALSRRVKHPGEGKHEQRAAWSQEHPLGRLPGSVWSIATQPLKVPAELGVEHYAAFPMEGPRRIIKGWSPDCGTVLDPCGGTGTTALVASVLGRHGITVDMSADYCRIARWRTADPKQRDRALNPKTYTSRKKEAPHADHGQRQIQVDP